MVTKENHFGLHHMWSVRCERVDYYQHGCEWMKA